MVVRSGGVRDDGKGVWETVMMNSESDEDRRMRLNEREEQREREGSVVSYLETLISHYDYFQRPQIIC